ncbi:bromodomain-containing protein 8, partial [Clonorchis sinensis]
MVQETVLFTLSSKNLFKLLDMGSTFTYKHKSHKHTQRLIKVAVMDYLLTARTHNNRQYGFMARRSANTCKYSVQSTFGRLFMSPHAGNLTTHAENGRNSAAPFLQFCLPLNDKDKSDPRSSGESIDPVYQSSPTKDISLIRNPEPQTWIRNFCRADFSGMRIFLNQVKLGPASVEDLYRTIVQKVHEADAMYVPKKPARSRTSRKLPKRIRRLLEKRSQLFLKKLTTGDTEDELAFRKMRNRCKSEIRQWNIRKQATILDLARKNRNVLFKYMRHRRRNKPSAFSLRDRNGEPTSDPIVVSEFYRDHYAGLYSVPASSSHPTLSRRTYDRPLTDLSLDFGGIFETKVMRKFLEYETCETVMFDYPEFPHQDWNFPCVIKLSKNGLTHILIVLASASKHPFRLNVEVESTRRADSRQKRRKPNRFHRIHRPCENRSFKRVLTSGPIFLGCILHVADCLWRFEFWVDLNFEIRSRIRTPVGPSDGVTRGPECVPEDGAIVASVLEFRCSSCPSPRTTMNCTNTNKLMPHRLSRGAISRIALLAAYSRAAKATSSSVSKGLWVVGTKPKSLALISDYPEALEAPVNCFGFFANPQFSVTGNNNRQKVTVEHSTSPGGDNHEEGGYPNELDEAKLLKLAMDYYTAQRREKLHAARLDLLKRIKIAEDDSEKLREGRYSEIPVSRLTIYRKRCRAFGITDVIGQKLGLEPLSPGTEAENQAIRDSLAVPELFNAGIGEEVTDTHGGTWYPLRAGIREVFSETEKRTMNASMSEFLRAQAILSRQIGTEVPDDEASSLDTSSSVKTHPDVHEIQPTLHSSETPLCRCTRSRRLSKDSLQGIGSDPAVSPNLQTDPLSPSGSAVISGTDNVASPPVTQSLNSSPGVSGIEVGSPASGRKSLRKGARKGTKSGSVSVQRVQTAESEPALSPLASDSGQLDELPTAATSALTLARRWRRSLLSAFFTICSHRHAYVFMQPVTEDIAPGYGSVVYEPVDLTSIRRRIESALSSLNSSQPSSSPTQILIDAATRFIRDLMLMFVNARMYNSQNHEVHQMAGDMFNDTMVELQPLWSVLVEDIPDFPSLPEPTKPAVSQSTTGRASLRKSVTKAAVGSVPSPSIPQNPPPTPDPAVTKTPSSTRPNKRFHPE